MHSTDHMANMRRNYLDVGLTEADLAADWLTQFERWFDEAVAAGLGEPNAMVLATASPSGEPAARSVLAKAVDAHGVTFYTNYRSAKSRDLAENPQVAVTFPWYALHRQVHVRGIAERVDRATTEAYWAERPRGAQLGASASPQSVVISGRAELETLQSEAERQFADESAPIPAPPHWGGWLIRPRLVEFWQGRDHRLHDRLRFRRTGAEAGPADDGAWVVERLAP